MFTGIIQDQGEIISIETIEAGFMLRIQSNLAEKNFSKGNSIAVNGVCLTVETFDSEIFSCTAVHETLDKTNISNLTVGDFVNLEAPLTMETPIAGHFVSGHVDFTSEVLEAGSNFKIKIPEEFLRFFPAKSSITINGVSLTVVEANNEFLRVALIPETLSVTNLGKLKPGSLVNVEIDLLARYIDSL